MFIVHLPFLSIISLLSPQWLAYQQPCDVISISALLVDWSIVARPIVDLNLNPPEALPLPEARKGRRPLHHYSPRA
jgi:hypothetical protein